MVLDFPDTKNLLEYEDYTSCPTKANASSFITLALEENWAQVQTSEGYAKYITTRPRAEHLGDQRKCSGGMCMAAAMSFRCVCRRERHAWALS